MVKRTGLLFFKRHHSVFVDPLSAINFMEGIILSRLLRKFALLKNKNRTKKNMRNKKLQVWLPLLLSLCMVAGMFIGYRIKGNMPDNGIFFVEKDRPVQEVLDLIKRKYVDSENMDSLGTTAIQSILTQLDPHSVYLPVQELKQVNEDLEGQFFGIGIEFNIINDTVNVVNVLEKGPSQQAGLLMDDQIIKVYDSLVAGAKINAVKLRKLEIARAGVEVNK